MFRGDDGLDELTTTGHSHIWEVTRGAVTEHDLNPAELGIARAELSDLVGGDPAVRHVAQKARLARIAHDDLGPLLPAGRAAVAVEVRHRLQRALDGVELFLGENFADA